MNGNSIKVGVSSCVVGNKVRFDSGRKESRFVTQELAQCFSFVPVCPEVGIGLPIPRPAIRLISDEERVRLVNTKDSLVDHTNAMQDYSRKRVAELNDMGLCGYIVCAKSPTCGMERVKVYQNNRADKDGVGLYTKELMEQMPWLPVEEDGRLNDPVLKENFTARVFCLKDLYDSVGEEPDASKIIAFHSRHKLTLMAHHPESYKALGRLVADVKQYERKEFFNLYRLGLMNAMKYRASRKNNTNVLMHIQGYFKKVLSGQEKQELTRIIHEYRIGELPILAPLTLIKHYLNRNPVPYLKGQKFFKPYPQALRLRLTL